MIKEQLLIFWKYFRLLIFYKPDTMVGKYGHYITDREIKPMSIMLKLKLQYSGHQIRSTDSLEKILMLGKSEGRRKTGSQRMTSLTQWTLVWASSGVGDGQRSLACCSPWGREESDTTEWLNWTELIQSRKEEVWILINKEMQEFLIERNDQLSDKRPGLWKIICPRDKTLDYLLWSNLILNYYKLFIDCLFTISLLT